MHIAEQPAPPKRQAPSSEHRSTASPRQSKVASSAEPPKTPQCPLSKADTIRHTLTPAEQSALTCVDAPSDASVFFGQVPACDQMRSCVRPQFAALTRRGPVWSFAGQVHFAYARLIGAPSGCWLSRPRSDDRMPLPVLRSVHIPDATRPAAAYAAAAGSR